MKIKLFQKILFFVIFFLLISIGIKAQKSTSHIIRINFLPVLSENSDYLSYVSFRTQFSLDYEMTINDFHPFIKVTYIGPKQYFGYFTYDNSSPDNYFNIAGYGIGTGVRFYSHNNKGIYLSPEIEYMRSRKYKPSSEGLLNFTKEYMSSIKVGRQWIKNSGFFINIYTGIGFVYRNYIEIIEEGEMKTAEYNGVGFRPYLGLELGYGF